MTAERLAEIERLFESRAGTEAGNAGRELCAELRQLRAVASAAVLVLTAHQVAAAFKPGSDAP